MEINLPLTTYDMFSISLDSKNSGRLYLKPFIKDSIICKIIIIKIYYFNNSMQYQFFSDLSLGSTSLEILLLLLELWRQMHV